MAGAQTRSLELMVLQAHRAKGVRYPLSAQKECFRTWYSYALRKGEVTTATAEEIRSLGRTVAEDKEAGPGGRTYL